MTMTVARRDGHQQPDELHEVRHDQDAEQREDRREPDLPLHDHGGDDVGLDELDQDPHEQHQERRHRLSLAQHEQHGQERGRHGAEERHDGHHGGEHAEGQGVGNAQDGQADPGQHAQGDHGEELPHDPRPEGRSQVGQDVPDQLPVHGRRQGDEAFPIQARPQRQVHAHDQDRRDVDDEPDAGEEVGHGPRKKLPISASTDPT
jgi:hypothetical protein